MPRNKKKTAIVARPVQSLKAKERRSVADETNSSRTVLMVKSIPRKVGVFVARPFIYVYRTLQDNRRISPHKSFQRTKKRDRPSRPKVEGLFVFPWYVMRTLLSHKWLYFRLLLTFVAIAIIAVGSVEVSNIGTIDSITGSDLVTSIMSPVSRAIATVSSTLTGALNNNLTDAQWLLLGAIAILAILSTVWLLRQQLAGRRVNMRDGLYGSAGPIAAEFVLVFIGMLQMLPFALLLLAYYTVTASEILTGGIETAMFTLALVLVAVLTLYFMTTTLFALFIATIPGTYPLKAYRAARQIVAGQRLRLLIRLLWMAITIVVAWFIIMVPVVIIVNAFEAGGSWVIPIAFQVMVGASFIYGTAYGYLLYRRMIDDPVKEY